MKNVLVNSTCLVCLSDNFPSLFQGPKKKYYNFGVDSNQESVNKSSPVLDSSELKSFRLKPESERWRRLFTDREFCFNIFNLLLPKPVTRRLFLYVHVDLIFLNFLLLFVLYLFIFFFFFFFGFLLSSKPSICSAGEAAGYHRKPAFDDDVVIVA